MKVILLFLLLFTFNCFKKFEYSNEKVPLYQEYCPVPNYKKYPILDTTLENTIKEWLADVRIRSNGSFEGMKKNTIVDTSFINFKDFYYKFMPYIYGTAPKKDYCIIEINQNVIISSLEVGSKEYSESEIININRNDSNLIGFHRRLKILGLNADENILKGTQQLNSDTYSKVYRKNLYTFNYDFVISENMKICNKYSKSYAVYYSNILNNFFEDIKNIQINEYHKTLNDIKNYNKKETERYHICTENNNRID